MHTTIASLAEGQVAVHSAAAFEPQGIVVDEYVKDSASGVYRLTNIATDLLRCDTDKEGVNLYSYSLGSFLQAFDGCY